LENQPGTEQGALPNMSPEATNKLLCRDGSVSCKLKLNKENNPLLFSDTLEAVGVFTFSSEPDLFCRDETTIQVTW
jgi:hypothetical protein